MPWPQQFRVSRRTTERIAREDQIRSDADGILRRDGDGRGVGRPHVTEAICARVQAFVLDGGYVSERAIQRGELRPSYRLKARVIRLDHLAAGEGVSYHRRWTMDKPVWAATLAIGHVDGYPSGAVKGCEVLVRGKLFPVIGTVSASHTVIAVGPERVVEVGDEATLVGPDHPALHPNEVARRAGWSEYNMFMHLSPHLQRRVTQ